MNSNLLLEDQIRIALQVVATDTPIPPAPTLDPTIPANGRWPRSSRATRAWSIAAVLGVAATVAGLLVSTTHSPAPKTTTNPSTGIALAGFVKFNAQGSYLDATVTDTQASTVQLTAVFYQRGLNVILSLVPVSPSLVGSIVSITASGSDAHELVPEQQGPCLTGGGGTCAVGLRIPAHFSGRAEITIGRTARPAETYATTAVSALAPGEALHCSALLGSSVAEAIRAAHRRGLGIEWRTSAKPGMPGTPSISNGAPPATYIVEAVTPVSSNTLSITAAPFPYNAADEPQIGNFASYNAALNKGCSVKGDR